MRRVLNGRAVFASTIPVTILKFHVNTVRMLRSRGYHVTLVASDGPDLAQAAEQSGAVSHAIPMARAISPVADAVALVRWAIFLVRRRPGVVIAGTPKCALLALTAARATGVPRRVYMCGGLRLEGEQGWRRKLLVAMEKIAMGAATEVVVNSRSLRDEVLAAGLVRPDALRQTMPGSSHGVDTSHFRPGSADPAQPDDANDGVPVLGFVGRLTRDKGVETLLGAAADLRARGVAFRLLVVGPQDEPDSRAWLERLEGFGAPMTITGPVADPAEHYRLMSLLLLPSRREGFPNVVLEAAASGVPTVTTEATGCRDAVLDGVTGRIVPVDDPAALADAVAALLGDRKALSDMGARARAWVEENFQPDLIAAQIVDPPGPAPAPRVLHVLPSLDAGGAERLVVELTTAARARGVDARIAVLGPTRDDSPVLADARTRGLPVTELGAHRFDPRGVLRLRRLAVGADVVHAHLFPAFYAVAVACSGRLVLTEHSPTNARRERRVFRVLERFAYRRFSVTAAISDGVADSLNAYLSGLGVRAEVAVVENGVRLDRFRPGPDSGHGTHQPDPGASLRLVAVGTLDARKDVGAAVRAVATLPRVSLTVVGDGPERAELEQLARDLDTDVTFLGLRADVPEILREHDALVITSRYEGFGLVAAEAMACGLPVLAPALPGLGEVVGDGGLVHTPGDERELAGDITRLRDDADLRRRLAHRARLRSSRFDLERTVETYLDLYTLPTGAR